MVISQKRKVTFSQYLGFAVGGDWEQLCVLGHTRRAGCSIEAAGGCEEKSFNACRLGGVSQVQRPLEVHRVGRRGVEMTQRVVGQSRKNITAS